MEPDLPATDSPGATSDSEIDPAVLEEKFGEILMLVVGTDLIFDMLIENE